MRAILCFVTWQASVEMAAWFGGPHAFLPKAAATDGTACDTSFPKGNASLGGPWRQRGYAEMFRPHPTEPCLRYSLIAAWIDISAVSFEVAQRRFA